MEQSLDDVLNGVEAGTVEAEIANTEVIEEAETAVEDIKGDPEGEEAEGKEPKAVEKPTTEDEDKEPWTKKAYLDEKRKRQELQRKLEEREKEPVKAPDIFENQEDYTSYVRNEIGAAVSNTRADMSEYFARREYGSDVVDEKFEKYQEMEAENPELRKQLAKSASPWHEMVEIVNKAEKFEALQDVDAYEAKIRAEIEAKVRKELEGEAEHESKKRESITPSLAGKRAAGGTADPLHQSLDEILGR